MEKQIMSTILSIGVFAAGYIALRTIVKFSIKTYVNARRIK